jgi:hypothetical protein
MFTTWLPSVPLRAVTRSQKYILHFLRFHTAAFIAKFGPCLSANVVVHPSNQLCILGLVVFYITNNRSEYLFLTSLNELQSFFHSVFALHRTHLSRIERQKSNPYSPVHHNNSKKNHHKFACVMCNSSVSYGPRS